MADKFTNTSSAQTRTFNKGLITDLSDEYLEEGVWTYGRNLVTNSHLGDKGHVGNEPANFLCAELPYTFIGATRVKQNTWVVFSTDDINSEIGLFDEATCKYTRVVNSACLNFKKTNLIKSVSKSNYDRTISVYFVDGLNPDRYINLDRIPYIPTGRNLSTDPSCFVPEYSKNLDCDKLLLSAKILTPKYSIKRSLSAGQLLNGSYQAVVAYSVNGIRVSDYFTPTNIQPVWNQSGIGGALDITVSNLDQDFDEYELVIVGIVNQQTVAKRIGYYSTRQSQVHISQIPDSLPTVDLALLPLQNPLYYKSDKIYELNDYLLRTGVYTRPEINYQPYANDIVTKWVEVQYPSDYYYKGGNKAGYMRDETYSFFIRWIYDTGHKSASYHIPGREALVGEKNIITGENVVQGEEFLWETQNTSIPENATGSTEDGGIIIRKGLMSYHESTEKYPDDQPSVWGDLCGKNIRHHKMPVTPIHSNNGENIIILGVEFSNIKHPVDYNGNPIKEIVGYEILRGSREGNKTVVAKGMFNNMREYKELTADRKPIIYQNYPYNDLRPDGFLTEYFLKRRNKDNANHEAFKPELYKKDHFSFHSPDTTFNKPFLGGNYISIYSQESGTAVTQFEIPYKHPKGKLISDGSLVGAAIIGVGIGLVSTLGKTTTGKTGKIGLLGFGVEAVASRESGTVSAIPDLWSSILAAPAQTGVALIMLAAQAAFFIGQGIDTALEGIYNLIKARDYAIQGNSHCFYNQSTPVTLRRNVKDGKYIGDSIQSIGDKYDVFNLYRNDYVLLQTQGELPNPSIVDNSRQRLQDLKRWKDDDRVFSPFLTTSSAYYGSIKVVYKNQYGQLDSIVQVPTGSGWYETNPDTSLYSSPVIFGGDVYINRYTEKNPYYFFNQWALDKPDGYEFDYSKYMNGPLPRYWANFERYDITDLGIRSDEDAKRLNDEIVDRTKKNPDNESIRYSNNYLNTPSNFHNLDREGSKSGAIFTIKNAYFYLFLNGVRDFFVESELNIAYRDQALNDGEKFYDPYGGYTDLSTIFRSDLIKKKVLNKYDKSLSASKIYANFIKWGSVLPRDYEPELYEKRFQYFSNRVIYSLQSQAGLRKDNWLTFLANNYKDLSRISTIKSMNGTSAMILYENSEPEMMIGQDRLETTAGVKLIIGDGGLFQGSMQEVVNADDHLQHGTCINERSAINTPYGLFYISQTTGKILNYTGNGLEDISNGIKYWLVDNLPSNLLKSFPNFKYYDNPVVGIGCETVFDPTYEKVYFTKRDYKPLSNKIKYTPEEGFKVETGRTTITLPAGGTISQPVYTSISLTDPTYFEDCSWTISYDPQIKSWVSYHDWHPNFMLPTYEHFFTIVDNQIWKHNSREDLFCEFYGVKYPFEVEFPITTPNNVTTLRSVEYYLETYKNAYRDRYHVFSGNFDDAVVYNSEQISGILRLNQTPQNPITMLNYPIVQADRVDILFSKEENKYRFNQFWDITNDRGEFTPAQERIWNTDGNGYVRALNSSNLNYNKSPLERKKFRHYNNKVLLRKLESNDLKMILKIFNTKHLNSPR